MIFRFADSREGAVAFDSQAPTIAPPKLARAEADERQRLDCCRRVRARSGLLREPRVGS